MTRRHRKCHDFAIRPPIFLQILLSVAATAWGCGTQRAAHNIPAPTKPTFSQDETPATTGRGPGLSSPRDSRAQSRNNEYGLPKAALAALAFARAHPKEGRGVFSPEELAAIVRYLEKIRPYRYGKQPWSREAEHPTLLELQHGRCCADLSFRDVPEYMFEVTYCPTCRQDPDGDKEPEIFFVITYSSMGTAGHNDLMVLDRSPDGRIWVRPLQVTFACPSPLEPRDDPYPEILRASGTTLTIRHCCNRPDACHACCHYTLVTQYQYKNGTLVNPKILKKTEKRD